MKTIELLAKGFGVFACLCAVACSGAQSASHSPDHGGHSGPHWGYAGESGPEHWGELQTEFATCASGQHQSPVDIVAGSSGANSPLGFSYEPTSATVLNNGHTIQVNLLAGSELHLGSATYPLVQFHFHAHSEHTLGGKTFPMELHLVHKTSDGKLAVVGVFIEEGASSAALTPVWTAMPEHANKEVQLAGSFDPKGLLPADHSYYHYEGSLTTPPCSEGVSWNVLKSPIQLSSEQISQFKKLYDHNVRPVQPLAGRKIDG